MYMTQSEAKVRTNLQEENSGDMSRWPELDSILECLFITCNMILEDSCLVMDFILNALDLSGL